MKKTFKIFAFLLLASYVISSCKKDNENPEENDNEVITTVEVHLTEQGNPANTLVFKYDDADGPGGAAATVDQITLSANKVYTVELVLLDKTKNPATVVSDEIDEEGDVHRFYFEPSAGANIAVTNLGTDANALPLGLTSTWTTTGAATGTLKITLRHYASGGKALADLVNSSKSTTDAEVSFETKVQ